MVVVHVGEKDRSDLGRAHIGSHHIAGDACTAIEKIMPSIIKCDENAGLRAIRVNKRRSGAKHGNSQDNISSRLELNDSSTAASVRTPDRTAS